MPASDFTVAICTRNRPGHLARTLDALAAQDAPGFPIVVVDQSDEPPGALAARPGVHLIRDAGRGLSRARNVAWRAAETRWIAFVDDDCLTAPDWARRLRAALERHPGAAFVSGAVEGRGAESDTSGLVVTAYRVERETVRRGRRTWPWAIGFGVCMAVRRDWIERLGGWDERLGAGVPDLPAAEDMDFNHRLLRAGGTAVAVPDVHAVHDQWRSPQELPALYGGYAAGAAGSACKQLRTGDVPGGLRLWAHGLYGSTKMVASAGRRRSSLRMRVGLAMVAGHVRGTWIGLRREWRA